MPLCDKLKLTCKVGTFYFDREISVQEMIDGKMWTVVREVPISHMQLVRDSVMDKILNNTGGGQRLRSTKDVYTWWSRSNGPASGIGFQFIPAPGYWIRQGIKQVVGKQHRNVPRAA